MAHHPALSSLRPARDEYSDGTLMDEVTQLMLAAAELCPDDAEVHVSIGVLYNVSLDYASAQAHFLRALACPPADEGSSAYATLNKLGATLANANRSDEAVGLYARALQQRPTYARGWLNLGISFANLNKHSEAAKVRPCPLSAFPLLLRPPPFLCFSPLSFSPLCFLFISLHPPRPTFRPCTSTRARRTSGATCASSSRASRGWTSSRRAAGRTAGARPRWCGSWRRRWAWISSRSRARCRRGRGRGQWREWGRRRDARV